METEGKEIAAVVCLVSVVLSGIAFNAGAQATNSLPRVAHVWIFGIGSSAPFADSFAGRLAELGWVDGKTVRIEYRDANADFAKLESRH